MIWDMNTKQYGLPIDMVCNEYKSIAEALWKTYPNEYEFRDWDNADSDLHSYSISFLRKKLPEMKRNHWSSVKEDIYEQLYELPLSE
jgi:hypothetical protein